MISQCISKWLRMQKCKQKRKNNEMVEAKEEKTFNESDFVHLTT